MLFYEIIIIIRVSSTSHQFGLCKCNYEQFGLCEEQINDITGLFILNTIKDNQWLTCDGHEQSHQEGGAGGHLALGSGGLRSLIIGEF